MTRLERSWTQTIVAAFAPEGGAGLSPLAGEIDYLSVFQRMGREATRKAALGLRLAVLVVTFAPPLMGMGFRLFSQLRPIERTLLLGRLLRHRFFAIRELTLLLKFAAAVALLGTDSVRQRSGYDHVQPAAEVESGVRHRLPVLPGEVGGPTSMADTPEHAKAAGSGEQG